MNVVYPNLSEKMKEFNITYADLAKELELPNDVLAQKLDGTLDWYLHEVIRICRLLRTSDAKFLFVQLDSKS